MDKAERKKVNEHCKMVHELSHTREDHALNIESSVQFVKPFIFTSIQRVEIRLFLQT